MVRIGGWMMDLSSLLAQPLSPSLWLKLVEEGKPHVLFKPGLGIGLCH